MGVLVGHTFLAAAGGSSEDTNNNNRLVGESVIQLANVHVLMGQLRDGYGLVVATYWWGSKCACHHIYCIKRGFFARTYYCLATHHAKVVYVALYHPRPGRRNHHELVPTS